MELFSDAAGEDTGDCVPRKGLCSGCGGVVEGQTVGGSGRQGVKGSDSTVSFVLGINQSELYMSFTGKGIG